MPRGGVSLPTIRKAGGFTVAGFKEARATIANVLDKSKAENLKAVFMRAGIVARDSVKRLAPYNPNDNRPGWPHVRDEVFVAEGKPQKPNVLVGVNVKKAPQGWWLEFGTIKMPAQPFFRPGINAAKPQMATIIADGIKKTIEDATE